MTRLCPKCGHQTKVVTVHREEEENVIVRYRRCQNKACRHNYITNQVMVLPPQFQEKIVETQIYKHRALSNEQVREIRSLYKVYLDGGVSILGLAQKYGVSDSTISKIMRQQTYKTVA